jgi:hypothetical protein
MKIPAFTSQKSDDFSTTYCALPSTNWGGDFSSFSLGAPFESGSQGSIAMSGSVSSF